MNTTHKPTRTRCAEHPLTHTEAQDFQRSLYVAGALLERAWQGNAKTPDRTVVVTAPGGRVLAHVRGTRATFTAPITITGSIEAAPDIELDFGGDEIGETGASAEESA